MFILVFVSISAIVGAKISTEEYPPHCTQVTKTTDYPPKFKYDYPTVYISSGTREVYQHLYCINPPLVSSAATVVCDWTAPPLVHYTLGDEFIHVIRVDPNGSFLGDAAILTHQVCSHNRMINMSSPILVTKLMPQQK